MNTPQSAFENLPLVGEANHRFANHLAVIVGAVNRKIWELDRLPAERVARTEVRGLLEDLAGTVYGIAELNRLIARNPLDGQIDLEELLRQATTSTINSLALQKRVVLDTNFSGDLRVPHDKANTVLLIVTEILKNAIKYAHPTGLCANVRLSCERISAGEIALEIEDDGIGLPEAFDVKTDGGMGFKVIRMLAHTLDAKLQIDSSPMGLGFRLVIQCVTGREITERSPKLALV